MGVGRSRVALLVGGLGSFPHVVAGVFETYVERGRVEPYADGTEDTIYLQGDIATSSTSPPTLRLWGSSPIQTLQDVLIVQLRSDDDWRLTGLIDCWEGEFNEDRCCGGEESCWGGIFTHERCCVRGPLIRKYLAADTASARVAASRLLMRYGLDEEKFEARRLRWRQGQGAAACSFEEGPQPPPLPPEFEEWHPETGLRAAFAVLKAAGLVTRRALHIGLQDGKSLDPLYPLILMEGLQGLGLEADPAMAKLARENLPQRFRINQSFVTPQNVWWWARPLGPLDVVVVDIDSFECSILEGLVDGALRSGKQPPSLLHFETNTAVPPPFRFNRGYASGFKGRPEEYADQQLASTSCSLSYAVHTFGARGYDLLFFGYDTIFLRRDLRPHFEAAWGREFPQDEFQCYRRSTVHATSGPMRYVREWFFWADDPGDLEKTLGLIRSNMTVWSAYDHLDGLPWDVFL